MIDINPYMSTIVVLEYLKIIKHYYCKSNKSYSESEFVKNLISQIAMITNEPSYLQVTKEHGIIKNVEDVIISTASKILDSNINLMDKKIKKENNDIIDLVSNDSSEEINPNILQIGPPSDNTSITAYTSVAIIENPYCRRSNRIRKKPVYYGFN